MAFTPGFSTRRPVGATNDRWSISPGIESLVVTQVVALRPGMPARARACNRTELTISSRADRQSRKGYRDRRVEHGAAAVPGRLGANRCGGPVIRRPHLQRGFHGDRGEPEHIAVTTFTR